MDFISEPKRKTPVIEKADIVVVGGGPAGISAAIAGARNGVKTFLVERYGFFGGMMTAGMVLTLGAFNSWIEPYERVVGGIPEKLLRRAANRGGAEDNESWALNIDPEIMKLAADELIEEAGVCYLLHSFAASPVIQEGQLCGVIVENKSGRGAILAKIVIDCTGDGDIAARAGAVFEKEEMLQPMTLCFQLGNFSGNKKGDSKKPRTIPIKEAGILKGNLLRDYSSLRRDVKLDWEKIKIASNQGKLPNYGGPWFGGMRKNEIWINSSRLYGDPTDAYSLTKAEIQGRKDIQTLIEFFRENIEGFKDTHLLSSGVQVGLRESRRFIGEYVLSGDDIRACNPFPDAVAQGCWPIDVHPSNSTVGLHNLFVPKPYQIPYRCLIPKGVERLLVAGRSISTTREAMGSTRIAGTCMALGEAAGTAAALAIKRGESLRKLNINILQECLMNQGVKLGKD